MHTYISDTILSDVISLSMSRFTLSHNDTDNYIIGMYMYHFMCMMIPSTKEERALDNLVVCINRSRIAMTTPCVEST